MQAATYRKTGFRAAVIAGLFCLTAGILLTASHTGGMSKLLSTVGGWFAGTEATAASTPPVKPTAPASDEASGWRNFVAGGKNFSSGISQVVPAAKKVAAQAVAAVDNVVHGTAPPSYGGSYSFHQSVGFVPGYPGWVDEGGGGGCFGRQCGGGGGDCHRTNTCGGGDDCHVTNTCGGGDDCHVTNTCGGGDDCHVTNTCGGGDDCHVTNTCGGGGDDCHKTNTCGGGDDCHKTNTCGCEGPSCNPHDVAEPESMPLLAAGLLIFAGRLRRRRVPARGGCGAVPGSR